MLRIAMLFHCVSLPSVALSLETQRHCEKWAATEEGMAQTMRQYIGLFDALRPDSVASATSAPVRAASEKAELARQRMVAAAKAYADATEDLAYQYRRCAR